VHPLSNLGEDPFKPKDSLDMMKIEDQRSEGEPPMPPRRHQKAYQSVQVVRA
jgi:hypothetical protein